jgi:hypothetical protein
MLVTIQTENINTHCVTQMWDTGDLEGESAQEKMSLIVTIKCEKGTLNTYFLSEHICYLSLLQDKHCFKTWYKEHVRDLTYNWKVQVCEAHKTQDSLNPTFSSFYEIRLHIFTWT